MNSWIDHVKRYARDQKVSYREAMKLAGATYRKASNEPKGFSDAEVVIDVKTKQPELVKEIMAQITLKQEKFRWLTLSSSDPNRFVFSLKKI